MDLSILLSEAAKLGFVVLLLLAAVIGLVKWVRSLMAQKDEQSREDRASAAKREENARAECLERESRLADRLSRVEDRQHGENAELLSRSVAALEIHARVIERLCDKDSGMHRALDRLEGRS